MRSASGKSTRAQPVRQSPRLVRQLGELGVFGFSFDMRHDAPLCLAPIIVSASQSPMRLFARQRQVADRCRRGSESTRAPNSALPLVVFFCRCDASEDTAYPRLSCFPDMLIDALVTIQATHPSPDDH